MQLKSSSYASVFDAGKAILARDGIGGMFRGFVPNVIKNAPNKSVQLTTFDVFKRKIKESEKALGGEGCLGRGVQGKQGEEEEVIAVGSRV